MLFNSYIFLFCFLPITVAGFWLLARFARRRAALVWLVLCSFFYYGYWNPVYVLLILISISFNFAIGFVLARGCEPSPRRKALTALGLAGNLGLLAYFKYANFFVDSINYLFESSAYLAPVVLPLAVSFFTFLQIAYLVDAYKGKVRERDFVDYCLFVTFFPHLIAGPIVHHAKLMPQFSRASATRFNPADFAGGLTLFVFGLAKKVLVADSISGFANPIYASAAAGDPVTFAEGWIAPLVFTFQLYFDFSGYSDMAIGLSLLFGIRMPINFNSPYKSLSTADFWRRWHATLGQFLREYLFIPLGGSKRGVPRQYANLMITMALSGLWHGAGWTYVLWGVQQGLFHWAYLTWSFARPKLGVAEIATTKTRIAAACFLTYMSWTIGMVLFRADHLPAAMRMYGAMLGVNGFEFTSGIDLGRAVRWLAVCFFIVWALPNSQQVLSAVRPVIDWEKVRTQFYPVWRPLGFLQWKPRAAVAVPVALLAAYAIITMERVQEFLYYQF